MDVPYAKILVALEGSIIKWDGICMGYGRDNGTADCPLCELFYDHDYDWNFHDNEFDYKETPQCYGCPASKGGVGECKYTPYLNWIYTWDSIGCSYLPLPGLDSIYDMADKERMYEIIYNAEAELIFLLGLLPEGHKWRDQI